MARTELKADQIEETSFDDAVNTAVTTGTSSDAVVNTAGDIMSGDLVVPNLEVTGDIDAATIITLNSGQTGAASLDGNITIERGDDTDSKLRWNETDDTWQFDLGDGVSRNISTFTSAASFPSPAKAGMVCWRTDEEKLYTHNGTSWESCITQTVTNGVTNRVPSEDAVYDAIDALFTSATSFPSPATAGMVCWRTDEEKLYTYNGTSWELDGGSCITQTVTNGVTDRAPSEDAVYDAIDALLPIGIVLPYGKAGQIANVASRSVQIGDDGSDVISMPGWYVCNGNSGTPNLIDKFIRGESTVGNIDGSDSATHNHTTPAHSHGAGSYWAKIGHETDNLCNVPVGNTFTSVGHLDCDSPQAANRTNVQGSDIAGTSSTESPTTNNNTVATDNRPAYYSLIFIIRIS